MTSQFFNETSFKRENETTWKGNLDQNWNIGDVPNGGYLLAVVLRAMQEQANSKNLLSVNAHYLRPGVTGEEAKVESLILREGSSISTSSGLLIQREKPSLQVLAAFGDFKKTTENLPKIEIEPPSIPSPENCEKRSAENQGVDLSIQNRVDVRVAEMGNDSDRSELYGWIKFCDSTSVDSLALALFSDAFPPSIFSKLGRVGWVPTVELTVHVRNTPKEGWIMGHFFTDDLQNGSMIETGRLWDSDGRLVAQSRQLALMKQTGES
tara:strand:- start:2735 stop:3532 length:798 start_codon:yes stop_codon:yes gene_type:complete